MANSPQVCFFLGANAPTGFYSLYDQLIDRDSARDYFLIKGGPGCGKSTLMRRVAARMEEAGHPVEYIQCSGDPDSLDGVVIPSLGAALVDATAPHVVEPTCPGALERYVNLGACYDVPALRSIRPALEGAMEGYGACYRRAYRCLTAAAEIRTDLRSLLESPQLEERLLRRAKGILSRECRKTGGQPGRSVQRFLGAVCCKGLLCRFDTAEALCQRRYVLCDSYGLAHPLLSALAAGAMAAGYDVIVCPEPTQPDRMAHLLIPSLSLGFLTSTPELPYEGHAYRRLRVDAMADPQVLRRSRARLRFGRKIAGALTEEAVAAMAQAKEKHDRLEALYNPHVDFDRVNAAADRLAAELLG